MCRRICYTLFGLMEFSILDIEGHSNIYKVWPVGIRRRIIENQQFGAILGVFCKKTWFIFRFFFENRPKSTKIASNSTMNLNWPDFANIKTVQDFEIP